MARELLLEISRGPKCPHCQLDTFDDWHHANTLKSGFAPVAITGSLRCHGCGKFFHIDHYSDGATHSSAYRAAGGEAK